MDKKEIVAFCKDWNDGMSVKDMANKYNLSNSVVRSRITALRKNGVRLELRQRKGVLTLSKADVASINRSL
mgnify:CR=1 FL=1